MNRRHRTKVFALAAFDGRTIGSNSLITRSPDLTLITMLQMLSSTTKNKSTRYRYDGILISCHRKYVNVMSNIMSETLDVYLIGEEIITFNS